MRRAEVWCSGSMIDPRPGRRIRTPAPRKKVLLTKLAGVLLLVAGFINVAASFATGRSVFALAAVAFFLAAILNFVRARQV